LEERSEEEKVDENEDRMGDLVPVRAIDLVSDVLTKLPISQNEAKTKTQHPHVDTLGVRGHLFREGLQPWSDNLLLIRRDVLGDFSINVRVGIPPF